MKSSVTEYEYEPVPGLPADLPPGEEILWQGAPCPRTLARRAFHTRKVVIYFLLLWIFGLGWALQGGTPLLEALGGSLALVIPAFLALGLLTLLARAMARSSLYTITDRRVVLRFGVATADDHQPALRQDRERRPARVWRRDGRDPAHLDPKHAGVLLCTVASCAPLAVLTRAADVAGHSGRGSGGQDPCRSASEGKRAKAVGS